MKIIGISNSKYPYHPYIVTVDEYVPIIFKTHDNPLPGPPYYRIGDFEYSLLEIEIDPAAGMIRGLTIVSLGKHSQSNLISTIQQVSAPMEEGLPIAHPDITNVELTDVALNFKMCLEGNKFAIDWIQEQTIKKYIRHKDALFVLSGDEFIGIVFENLTKDQIEKLHVHLSSAIILPCLHTQVDSDD
jgi:hypothetical protein